MGLVLKYLAKTAAVLLAMSTTASAEILWGVNGHPFAAYPGIDFGDQIDYLADLGMKSYRVDISGLDAADRLAALVAEGKKRGVEILPVITPNNLDFDKDTSEQLFEKTRSLANALGTRFKADIRVWELGNEMETYAIIQPCEMRDDGTKYPCGWGPAGGVDPLQYYGPRWAKVSAVLKGLSVGMTEADPTIRKAMGTAGWGHVGAFERMQNDGIEWDISVWHMYGEDPEWAFERLARYNRPIWVTEFNNPLGSQSSEQLQARGLERAMSRLKQLEKKYRVEAAHIYELLDEPYWAPSFEASMGLVRMVGSSESGWSLGEPKPAYTTAREFTRGARVLPKPRRDCSLAEIKAIEPLPLRQSNFAYCLMLGRTDDAEAIARSAAAIDAGEVSVFGLLLTLYKSDEFRGLYSTFGLSDRAYVSFLYRLLVDRDADGGGLDSYAAQLRSGSLRRDNIVHGMTTSSEFAAKYVDFLKAPRSAISPPPG
ncbi:MAG: hypothetical protein ABS35_34855 [Kaistia sp. SCN 65-12]|nr:MAG: hypothetical protein ABS35_34855 [Kaistia sp. SCN 65-12]